jgi:hypothetical protein
MNMRTYRGANADLDHYHITGIKIRINRSKYFLNIKKTIRYNISNSKQTQVRNDYQQEIKE